MEIDRAIEGSDHTSIYITTGVDINMLKKVESDTYNEIKFPTDLYSYKLAEFGRLIREGKIKLYNGLI